MVIGTENVLEESQSFAAVELVAGAGDTGKSLVVLLNLLFQLMLCRFQIGGFDGDGQELIGDDAAAVTGETFILEDCIELLPVSFQCFAGRMVKGIVLVKVRLRDGVGNDADLQAGIDVRAVQQGTERRKFLLFGFIGQQTVIAVSHSDGSGIQSRFDLTDAVLHHGDVMDSVLDVLHRLFRFLLASAEKVQNLSDDALSFGLFVRLSDFAATPCSGF